MGRQLDAVGEVEASELRLQVHGVRLDAAGAGAAGDSSSARRPRISKACDAMDKAEPGSCAKYHLNEAGTYIKRSSSGRRPQATCSDGNEELHGLQCLAAEVAGNKGLSGDSVARRGASWTQRGKGGSPSVGGPPTPVGDLWRRPG